MVEVQGVRVSYNVAHLVDDAASASHGFALDGVDCGFAPGEVVSLAGLNGSGKSTLARLLCAMSLATAGRVLVDGIDPSASDADRLEVRRRVGFVQQDPVDQIVSTLVFDEVAFGPRNLGLDEDEVSARVRASLCAVGLDGFDARDVNGLSGGEQQRIALAGVLAMDPAYLVLDEATSHLDSAARPAFRTLVDSLAHQRGLGIIQVTHDPVELLASDRVLVLQDGRVAWQGSPRSLLMDNRRLWDALTLDSLYVQAVVAALKADVELSHVNTPQRMCSWLQEAYKLPDRRNVAAVDAVADAAASFMARADSSTIDRTGGAGCHRAGGIVAQGVSFAYEDHAVLHNVDLTARSGEVLLLAGRSGSGKSTLAMLLAGLFDPGCGTILIDGEAPVPSRCGLAFQRPENQLFQQTVEDEIAFAPRNAGVSGAQLDARVEEIARRTDLPKSLLARSPFELSGGQARRVGLACVLSLGAGAYVLDEPTAGLDAPGRRSLHALVRELAAHGATVVLISHDLDEWLDRADRVALMGEGKILWTGSAAELSAAPGVYRGVGIEPPDAALILEALYPGAPEAAVADARRGEPRDNGEPRGDGEPEGLVSNEKDALYRAEVEHVEHE